ncbi:DUF2024 family protein [Fulvivirga sp. 29W222]|uniref:DUF2024 family protein n=1 Tax=Fulvivirga marina TaxID=2494733 RepID=A0A937FT99_9BACT|nr:DUF2024 family protein [Fulvivirga marina]MBL6445164.1 DUF2024 family protein [Fulvivirga marina]
MQVSVFDTYVKKKEGGLMHFDILVPVELGYDKVIDYGKEYLKSKEQEGQSMTARECKFCHIEQATDEVQLDIETRGYHIIEMQGC